MSWALLSILAALIWAVGNIVDKFVLTKWVRQPIVPVAVFCFGGLLASSLIFLFRGFSELSPSNVLLAFLAGSFYFLAQIFYYKAAKLEEISRVIPVVYTAPLFVLILAAVFFGEVFGPKKYFGIFLLLGGAVFISSKTDSRFAGTKVFSKAFCFAALCALMLALTVVLTKYLLNFADVWTTFSYVRVGTFLALIPAFWFYSRDFASFFKESNLKSVGFMALSSTLTLTGLFLFTLATSVGYVSLASALTSIQPFFTFILATIMSLFLPAVLKEENNGALMFKKILAILLIIVGGILII